MQRVRGRGARQERLHARRAALPLQGLRAELHRHAAARHAVRVKVEAVLLYLSGLSMNRTAKLLGVSTPSVQAWIERFAEVYAQKPEPEGRAVVVELDEMWHFLKKRPTNSGSGRLGIVLRDGLSTGNPAVVTRPLRAVAQRMKRRGCPPVLRRRLGRLRRADPQGRLFVGKEETQGIERDHSRQRHWLARFRRCTAWSPGPSVWSRPRSRSSPASRTTAGSMNSYLC